MTQIEQPYPVPENWNWVRLTDVADIIMGQSPSGADTTENPADMPLVGGAADLGLVYPSPGRYTRRPTKISVAGDLILCIRATLGRPVFSNGEYCLGRGVAAIRPHIGTKEFYRYFFLNFEQYLYDHAAGSTFAQVTRSVLQDMPVPIPPLPEQNRIVAHIESLFTKLNEAEEKLQAVVDGFEYRKAAILHKAFTGELTAKWREEHGVRLENWKLVPVAELCHSLKYGTAKKSKPTGSIAVIRMGNLQNGEIEWSNLAYTDDEDDIKKYLLSPGDVLFNRTNSPELVGKTAIYRGEYPAVYAGYLIKLDYRRDRILGEYLNYVLNSVEAKEYCRAVKTDGVNQSNINAKKIGMFPIPAPTLEEQTEIVRLIGGVLRLEAQALSAAQAALSQIDLMKKSILARAFRGELGTNDPVEPPPALEER